MKTKNKLKATSDIIFSLEEILFSSDSLFIFDDILAQLIKMLITTNKNRINPVYNIRLAVPFSFVAMRYLAKDVINAEDIA